MKKQRRALFISHGGGPLPLLGDEAHREMVTCLKDIAQNIERPSAIIVISAHWEAEQACITSAASPDLIYDYYGFPPKSYDITYPCPGHPELAQSIKQQFDNAGIAATLDSNRGFDHGLFIPLKIMYPEADIPCVQVSLLQHLEPMAHIELGRALQSLAEPSLLVIGSGFSFHNMKAFFAEATAESGKANKDFEYWLAETVSSTTISEQQRTQQLLNWTEAPSARYCHPREEHLLPLHVCYGFAESACKQAYTLSIINKVSSMYLWEND